jgi:uncharacterized FlaG/YvyC family protein
MRTSTFYAKTRTALVIAAAFFVQSQAGRAQWSTSGSNVYYNGGNVGIGTASPFRFLQIANTGTNADLNLGLTGPGPSILFSETHTAPLTNWAKIGLATGSGHFSPNSQSGDLVIETLTSGGGILFATGSSTTEAFRVSGNGDVGIGTTSPTAKLHTDGNVRFQNLPSGTGNILVVDGDGNVYVSSQTARIATQPEVSGTEKNDEITALKNKIEKLEAALEKLQQQFSSTNGNIEINTADVRNFQLDVNPNPAKSGTTIRYSYPTGSNTAFVNITDLSGKLIKRIDIKKSNKSSINFSLEDVASSSGIYIYTLEVNNKVVMSKKVVFAK